MNLPKRLMAVAAVALMPAVSAHAQKPVTVDMSKYTCAQLLEGTADSLFTAVWLSGYFNGTRKNAKLDLDNVKRNAETVSAACKSNPKQTVMDTVVKMQSQMR